MHRTLILTLLGSGLAVLFVAQVALISYGVGLVPREKRWRLPLLWAAAFLALGVLEFCWVRYVRDPQATLPSVLLRSWWLYLGFLLGWCLSYVKEWRRARRDAATGEGAVLPGEGASLGGPE